MKIKGSQLEAGEQLTTTQDLGIWRRTGFGSFVADASAIKAQGGSRKVCLPSSTLRIGDLEWEPTKDVEGRVVCWRRNIAGVPVLILNDSQEETMTTKRKSTAARDHGTAESPKPVSYALPDPAPEGAEVPKAAAKAAAKPLDFLPQESAKAVRQGTKLAALVDLLSREEGATLAEVGAALSVTGSRVDVAMARSWITFDLKNRGYGVRTVGDRLRLILPEGMASPPAHLVASEKVKAPAPVTQEAVAEAAPKLKKAAMRPPKKSKKAKEVTA